MIRADQEPRDLGISGEEHQIVAVERKALHLVFGGRDHREQADGHPAEQDREGRPARPHEHRPGDRCGHRQGKRHAQPFIFGVTRKYRSRDADDDQHDRMADQPICSPRLAHETPPYPSGNLMRRTGERIQTEFDRNLNGRGQRRRCPRRRREADKAEAQCWPQNVRLLALRVQLPLAWHGFHRREPRRLRHRPLCRG